MNANLRTRVFTPLVMPLALLGVVLLFAGSLSRIMLAVDKTTSVVVAVAAAAYVMAMGFVIERNEEISSKALGVGIALGLLGLTAGGAIAMSQGVRDVHHGEEDHSEEGALADDVLTSEAVAQLDAGL